SGPIWLVIERGVGCSESRSDRYLTSVLTPSVRFVRADQADPLQAGLDEHHRGGPTQTRAPARVFYERDASPGARSWPWYRSRQRLPGRRRGPLATTLDQRTTWRGAGRANAGCGGTSTNLQNDQSPRTVGTT